MSDSLPTRRIRVRDDQIEAALARAIEEPGMKVVGGICRSEDIAYRLGGEDVVASTCACGEGHRVEIDGALVCLICDGGAVMPRLQDVPAAGA